MNTDISIINLNIDYKNGSPIPKKICDALVKSLTCNSVFSFYGKGNFSYSKIIEIEKNLSKEFEIDSHYHKYHKIFDGKRKDISEISSTKSDTILVLCEPKDYYYSARFIHQNRNKNIKKLIFLQEFEKKFMFKTGIYINIPEIYNHFKNVINLVNQKSVCVILHNSLKKIHFKKTLEKTHTISVFYDDYLASNSIKIDTLITTSHLYYNNSNISPIEVIARYKVFLHYSLGFSEYFYNDRLKFYDSIFTYGTYTANLLKRFTDAEIYKIGYPRYDNIHNLEKSACLNKLKFKKNWDKPIITWMPSLDEFSSFAIYHKEVTTLLSSYSLIIKPHPLSTKDFKIFRKHYSSKDNIFLIDYNIDNSEIFKISNFIIADYGGTIFGSIYNLKKLILLDIPRIEKSPLLGKESPEFLVREVITHFNKNNLSSIPKILSDTKAWEQQLKKLKRLKKKFFSINQPSNLLFLSKLINNFDNRNQKPKVSWNNPFAINE